MAPQADEVSLLLGRLEGKLDAVIATLSDHRAALADVERRVRTLERWKWTVMGGAAALSLVADYALRIIKN